MRQKSTKKDHCENTKKSVFFFLNSKVRYFSLCFCSSKEGKNRFWMMEKLDHGRNDLLT